MRLRRDQSGVTLVELMVGTAVAGILLISVASLEISAWRQRRANETAFAGQAEATTVLDRFAQDVRSASNISLAGDGASTVTLTVMGSPVTYQLSSGLVLRQGRTLMRGAAGLQFYREESRTLRAVVTAGNGYRLESRATSRQGP